MHDAPLTMPAQFLRLRRLSLKKATRPAELARWTFPFGFRTPSVGSPSVRNLRPWRTREWTPCDTAPPSTAGQLVS
jgi:hypothetical protein